MTPQEIEALKAERDALAVQIDLMKAAIKNVIFKAGIVSNICYNIGQQHNESKQILQAVSEYDAARRRFNDLISLDAQQCLRDVKAESVKNFVEFNAGRYSSAFEAYINDALKTYLSWAQQGGAEC